MAPTDLPAFWGKRLAEHRIAAGLSQDALAQRVGVSRSQVWKLEAGKHAPSDPLRIRLAAAFDTTVPALFPHDVTAPADAA